MSKIGALKQARNSLCDIDNALFAEGKRTPAHIEQAIAAIDVALAEPEARTYEHHNALRQGHCIEKVDKFFDARPSLDGPDERKCFEEGFNRGFDVGVELGGSPATSELPAPISIDQIADLTLDVVDPKRFPDVFSRVKHIVKTVERLQKLPAAPSPQEQA